MKEIVKFYEWTHYGTEDKYNRAEIDWPPPPFFVKLRDAMVPPAQLEQPLTGRLVRPDIDTPIYDNISCMFELKCVSSSLKDFLQQEAARSNLLFYPVRLEEAETGLVLEDYFLMVCADIISKLDLKAAIRAGSGSIPDKFDLKLFRPKTDRGKLIVREDLRETLSSNGFRNLGLERILL